MNIDKWNEAFPPEFEINEKNVETLLGVLKGSQAQDIYAAFIGLQEEQEVWFKFILDMLKMIEKTKIFTEEIKSQ